MLIVSELFPCCCGGRSVLSDVIILLGLVTVDSTAYSGAGESQLQSLTKHGPAVQQLSAGLIFQRTGESSGDRK